MLPTDESEPFVPIGIDPLFSLQIAHSVSDVANILGLEAGQFFYIVTQADTGRYYKEFTIPKKKGGLRIISAPRRGLGVAQTRLADLLLKKYNPRPCVKGYTKGESFLSNAQYHENQRWILNIDLKDFYPSITFPRVRGLFMSSFFGFNDRVSTILARITTTSNGLPQGARTSPILANLIARNLDIRLMQLATQEKLRYTRYADDITFSSSAKQISTRLVPQWEPEMGSRTVTLGHDLTEAVRSSGFQVNHEKTRLSFKYERQEVTGLIVNKKANVWRKDISRLRMMIHSISLHGSEKAAHIWVGAGAKPQQLYEKITGWLSFIRQVRGNDDPVLSKLCRAAVNAGISHPDWVARSAEMVREYDVFLSHASEDKVYVTKLNERLKNLGVTVFFDVDSIKWGDSIPEKINHGLLKSIFFVPFLSDTFANKGWTNKELNAAININISRSGRILPLVSPTFSVGENYPLLSDLLYKKWPDDPNVEDSFVEALGNELLLKIEEFKRTSLA